MAPSPETPLLRVRDLRVRLHAPGGTWQQVLDGVDLTIEQGAIVGVIGETGSGKTTLGRTIVGLVAPSEGSIELEGRDVARLRRRARRTLRREGVVQLVFQDPLRSLDPALRIGEIVAEGLAIRGDGDAASRREDAIGALELVGLYGTLVDRRPGEVSGGQRQRVAIARALVTRPRLLICDEPVSALDAANRGFVLALLGRLRDELGIAMAIISHDLVSMAGVADRVAVLNEGRIVEEGPTERVFSSPQHPYSELLLASAPRNVRERWRANGAAAAAASTNGASAAARA